MVFYSPNDVITNLICGLRSLKYFHSHSIQHLFVGYCSALIAPLVLSNRGASSSVVRTFTTMINAERWQKFSQYDQLLAMAAELTRAQIWQYKDQEKFKLALERSLELIDLSLEDKKWVENFFVLLVLRQEVAKFYASQRVDSITALVNVF